MMGILSKLFRHVALTSPQEKRLRDNAVEKMIRVNKELAALEAEVQVWRIEDNGPIHPNRNRTNSV